MALMLWVLQRMASDQLERRFSSRVTALSLRRQPHPSGLLTHTSGSLKSSNGFRGLPLSFLLLLDVVLGDHASVLDEDAVDISEAECFKGTAVSERAEK